VVGEVHAQAGPGLQPVPGASILVFQVDNTGNPVTSASNPTGILAQTTTGADGTFSVNLPAGTSLASNVIVQATTGMAPARVCDPSTAGCPPNQTNLNCPAVSNNLNINPAAELATRQIFRRIAQAGANGNLGNYTNQEIAAFITLVQTTVAADPTLIASNLNDTLNNIRDRVQNLIDDVLPGIETSGQADPTAVSGIYNFVGFNADPDQGNLRRTVEFGTVVFNANGTWNVASQEQGGVLAESCSASCSRTFTQSAFNRTNTENGTYVRAGNDRLLLSSSDGKTTVVVFTNPTGTIAIVPFVEASGFAVAVKQGSGLSNATAQGNTFNWKEFGSFLSNTQTTGSPWQGPLQSKNGSGTAAFTATNGTIEGNGSGMGQQVTCTLTATGCTLVATLGVLPSNINFITPFSIAPTGALTLQDTDPGTPGDQTVNGEVSADGNVALFTIPQTNGGSVIIATKQATGLNNANLTGTYNLVVFGEVLTTSGAIITFEDLGTVTFDGAGNQTIQTIETSRRRTESCPSNAACTFTTAPIPGSTFTQTRPYNLATDGTLTITSPTAGTINGFVSPDGTFAVTTNSVDNVGGISRRTIGVAVKRS